MEIRTVSDIIKQARGSENQADFAKRFGKKQGSISKYENNLASPPMNIVNKCLEIICDRGYSDVSSDALAKRLKKLDSPAYFHLRKVIESILNAAKV